MHTTQADMPNHLIQCLNRLAANRTAGALFETLCKSGHTTGALEQLPTAHNARRHAESFGLMSGPLTCCKPGSGGSGAALLDTKLP